jgi:hypothetical protein
MNLAQLGNPIFLKVAGGAALYLLGGRIAKLAGIGLAAWGGWDYLQRPKVLYQSVPMPKISALSPWDARARANLGSVRS